MSAAITRRALMAGAGAALGVVALPAGVAAAAPAAFDPAAYCADLKAVGCQPYAFRRVSLDGVLGPWRYGISAAADSGFGENFDDVIRRWSMTPGDWPDKHRQVAAFIAGGAP